MADVTGLRVEVLPAEIASAFLLEPPGWTRLEPQSVSGDPTPGLEARVHDPLWLLHRQRQLGEFRGEDVGSPVAVTINATVSSIVAFQAGDPAGDAAVVPWREGDLLEPIVEREPTPPNRPGLRQRAEAGAQLFAYLRDAGVPEPAYQRILAACPLVAPWSDDRDAMAPVLLRLLGGRLPDGERAAVVLDGPLLETPPSLPAWFDGIADAPSIVAAIQTWYAWYRGSVSPISSTAPESWVADRLEYRFSLGIEGPDGQLVMRAPAFVGGRVDWFDVDHEPGAAELKVDGSVAAPATRSSTLLAAPLRFAGMPADRYWEFEDATVNLGALQVQPHDLARLALAEFAMVFGSDWLILPLDVPFGSLVTIDSVSYSTTFGEEVIVPSTDDSGRTGRFRLFELSQHGSDASLRALFVPPSAASVIEGVPIEEVVFARDEMANMAWAVERFVEGPSGDPRNRGDEPGPPGFTPGTDPGADMDYLLENEVPDRWIPLLPVSTGYGTIALRKGAMIKEGVSIEPLGVLLRPGEQLTLQDEEVAREGIRVRRVPAMARGLDGRRVRWVARRVDVGRGEASSGLAFDIAVRRTQGE